jgi:hypothetical protein
MTMHESIARFFVGPPALVQGDHGQAAGPRRSQFEVMTVGTDEADAEGWCRDALARLGPGGYLAIALDLRHVNRLRRLAGAIRAPRCITRAERALARAGAEPAGRYGVAPDLDAPTVVYQLGGAAARYAEKNLLLGTRSRAVAALCRVLRLWMGCDPSLGAILVDGRRP